MRRHEPPVANDLRRGAGRAAQAMSGPRPTLRDSLLALRFKLIACNLPVFPIQAPP